MFDRFRRKSTTTFGGGSSRRASGGLTGGSGGLLVAGLAFLAVLTVVLIVLGWWWSREPAAFNVRQVALQHAPAGTEKLVVGATFTSALIHVGETLLDKRGGYLSNDILPPGVWLDNMPNWEFGALVMLRDGSAALRNHISRSQSQSAEDPNLSRAEPQFNFQNDSWALPSTEGEYRDGLDELGQYLARLSNPAEQHAQFFARADNLRSYLEIVEKRLGSLSQRLSASVGQERVNTDLAGDASASQSTDTPESSTVQTPWLQIDDVFYEARGATWALRGILNAVAEDFSGVLEDKNARVSLHQIIRELDATQRSTFSPVILNGNGFGIFSNYSLTMANYIARANAAIIDLRDLLEKG
jgi:hypothetical protein